MELSEPYETIHLMEKVEKFTDTLFSDVILVHQALGDLLIDEINTKQKFLGRILNIPIIIDSMMGGTSEGIRFNEVAAKVAEEFQIGFAVGSQGKALTNSDEYKSFKKLRNVAPNAFIIANLSANRINSDQGIYEAKEAINMIKADAISIHLNPLEDVILKDKKIGYKGLSSSLKGLKEAIHIPVIIKEVGTGLSRESGLLLQNIGIEAINLAGTGGTNWAYISSLIAKKSGKYDKYKLAKVFYSWGIPTAASILEMKSLQNISIIASGGIRNGLDIAKAINLGAHTTALALPFLKDFHSKGINGIRKRILTLHSELKLAMFLTGSRNLEELSGARRIITGKLKDWEDSLNDFYGEGT
jgi:isopentenyl-diphosphate delta-isomerase